MLTEPTTGPAPSPGAAETLAGPPGPARATAADAREVVLEVRGLVKGYDGLVAVDHVSFVVRRGEIFGLLGPNGAGKTTTIRMIMDILRPDEGRVVVLGAPPAVSRERVGYLPEERGLYPGNKVLETLVYLAELKGIDRAKAIANGRTWLERVELTEWADHKVEDLSRGMRQKLQVAASLVHDPEIAILDEPFQGLDPVNVELIKRIIRDMAGRGCTVVLSAHQMNLVEALCESILLVHHGRAVLYGRLEDIKRERAEQTVRLRATGPMPDVPGVVHMSQRDGITTLTLGTATADDVLRHLVGAGVSLTMFEVATAPLDDIFLAAVGAGGDDAESAEAADA